MHLHALPHHGNFSLIGMWAGVVLVPTTLLALLFVFAHLV